VFDCTCTADVTINWHVEGWIGDHHLGLIAGKEGIIGARVSCVSAEKTVIIQYPEIINLGCSRFVDLDRRKSICRRCCRGRRGVKNNVDFRRFKSDGAEIEVDVEFRQETQFIRQQRVVPCRFFGKPIVRKRKGATFFSGEMRNADCGISDSPVIRAARVRASPVMSLLSSSIRTGITNPNLWMLPASMSIFLSLCWRGLLILNLSSAIAIWMTARGKLWCRFGMAALAPVCCFPPT
jgi:hypothetical protein